jgi:hypothetical protein
MGEVHLEKSGQISPNRAREPWQFPVHSWLFIQIQPWKFLKKATSHEQTRSGSLGTKLKEIKLWGPN